MYNFSSTVFSSSTETQPRSQIFSADFFCTIDVILPDISNILQIWSKQNSVKMNQKRRNILNDTTQNDTKIKVLQAYQP